MKNILPNKGIVKNSDKYKVGHGNSLGLTKFHFLQIDPKELPTFITFVVTQQDLFTQFLPRLPDQVRQSWRLEKGVVVNWVGRGMNRAGRPQEWVAQVHQHGGG